MYGVSRITVRRAVSDLVQEGLLERVQGKGTFVTTPGFVHKHRERLVREIKGVFGDMTSRGFTVTSKVLEKSISTAVSEVMEQLHLELGDAVFKIVRLRYVNGQPDHIVVTYIPYEMVPDIELYDFDEASLYGILRQDYGVILGRARYLVEADLATSREVELLEIAEGSPMLVIYSTIYGEDGGPIVFGYSRHRADKGQVEFEVEALQDVQEN
jgi:GntR family transcriptional regulator